MAVTDQVVQVAPDSTGKKIDNSELTRDDGTVVERQRVNISDPEDPNAHTAVHGEAQRGVIGARDEDLLGAIAAMHATLTELLELMQEFVYS